MYLKRLEMQGFKSFVDKSVLEFRPGITSVIGPNGSGKSNISDAIRWILGEQSMKALRGTKSTDVIFAGTQARKSLGFAEASLVFDNEDGNLPIEYSEVTVTRKIYRSGETGYYINKTPCRLKDVLTLFMDTGIGKDGYSIIGQGKIDEILSNKSEDRRHIFEEAAGIVKYRTRKEESEKKLERTKLNLLRINDILNEIENNIDPLKAQAEKAKQYLDLREELKDIELGLFLYNIEKYKKSLEEFSDDEDSMNETLNLEEGKLERIKQIKEELKSEIDEITEKIENMSNLGFESQKKIENLNSDINVANTKIENNKENKERYEKEIEEFKNKIEDLKKELEVKNQRKDNLKQNKEKFEKELKQKEKELEKITKKLSEKELEIEGKKKEVEENTDKKYELQSEISRLKADFENLNKRKKQIENEIESSVSELDSTRLSKDDIQKGFYEIDSKRNSIISELDKISEKKTEKEEKLKSYENTINTLNSDLRMKESRLNFLIETEKEKEGYAKSIKALLEDCEKIKELGKGMHGVLANIISVPKEYETAIEMCLGSSLQNIVTDNEHDAKKLIDHLRKNKLGRASFLPIASVKGKKIDKIKGEERVIGIASDLVKFDKKYEQIVLNLLGRTVIVDNMDDAITIAKKNDYSFRIVTIEGDVINPSGLISGGSVSKKTVNILGRGREIEDIEKEIKNIKENIKKEEAAKEKFVSESDGTIGKISELEKNLQEIEITYATEKQKVKSIDENVKKLEQRVKRLRQESEDLTIQKEDTEKEIETNNNEIKELTEKNEKLSKVIQEFANLNKDDQKYIDDLNYDITNLKISVSSFDESESSIEEMTAMINQEIDNNSKSIENKKTSIEQIKVDDENQIKKIEQTKKEIEKIKDEVQNSGSKIENLKQDRAEKNEKLRNQEEAQAKEYEILEDIRSQVVKMDIKKSKIEDELNRNITSMWEEYELTPNTVKDYKKPDNIALTQKKVKRLRQDIKELGDVNVNAIEEYNSLKQRYDFMCEQRLDLENTMTKLISMIQQMTKAMKDQFKSQFAIINKNFGQVFKELFGGGKAELTLSDENNILESGIEINVQPPGKRLQNMMLLSGGEKAFTAIALLFAILKMNPAPFCVLDEIEAALDDINVYRFADYLKKYSKDTQFLVITHRKGTMEVADTVYGVTMEEHGISKMLSMKLK